MLSLIRTCWTTIAPHFNHWLISWWWIMVHVGVASRFPQMQKLPERHWKVPWNFWQVEVDTNRALGDQDCSIYECRYSIDIYICVCMYTIHTCIMYTFIYTRIYICFFHSQTMEKVSLGEGRPPFRATWLDFSQNIFIFAHGYLDSPFNQRMLILPDPLHDSYGYIHVIYGSHIIFE